MNNAQLPSECDKAQAQRAKRPVLGAMCESTARRRTESLRVHRLPDFARWHADGTHIITVVIRIISKHEACGLSIAQGLNLEFRICTHVFM